MKAIASGEGRGEWVSEGSNILCCIWGGREGGTFLFSKDIGFLHPGRIIYPFIGLRVNSYLEFGREALTHHCGE